MTVLSFAAPDFGALFNAAPNLYLVLDTNFEIVAVNDAYCQATGVARDELVGRGLFDIRLGPSGDNLRASLERVLRTKLPDAMQTQHYPILRLASDGGGTEQRQWSPLNTPVFGPDGDVRWIIHRLDDVTDFVRLAARGHDRPSGQTMSPAGENLAAHAPAGPGIGMHGDLLAQAQGLHDTNMFFDTVIENIPTIIAVKRASDLSFVLLNRAVEQVTGVPRAVALGKTDSHFLEPDQADVLVARDRAALAMRDVLTSEEEVMDTPAGRRYLMTRRVPLFDAAGEAQYLVLMSIDITEQKSAAAALKSSESRFASLMAASPDAVIAVNADATIVIANERVRDVFGYEPHELIGQPASILGPLGSYEQTYARLAEALADPRSHRLIDGLDGLRRDGTVFPMEVSLSAQAGEDDVVVTIAIRDVTNRKAVENQLRQALKMEAIGNLTGGLAHDFNNLLSVVIGNLDLQREKLSKGSSVDDLADEALQAALRGAELTRQLLAFARRQPLAPKITDVNGLIDGVSRLLRRTLGSHIEMRVETDPELWPVMVDPVQFEASLVNLATNARDAMPKGGTLQIRTSNQRLDDDYVSLHRDLVAGDYTLIEVTDSGTGIPREMLDKVFEPFFTTKKEGHGTGLGLSMVFGFMKQSGGHINVYSEPIVGTTFRLYLPRAMGSGATPAPVEAPTAFALGAAETVLAVEDNPGLRDLVVRQLRQLGYNCLEAADGPSALKMLEQHDVDLLFSDVIMPGGMSGYELGRLARTRWPRIKVLLTSGFPEEKINGNGQAPWNMRLLLKPYRKEDLALALREVLAEDLD